MKRAGNEDQLCAEIVGISRATYYRYKKVLSNIDIGIFPPSKRPKKRRQKQWGEKEMKLILQLRQANLTYGKAKLKVILRRDHNLKIGEGTVGRILRHLMDKGLVTKSISALRCRRKRNFSKTHSQPWCFKNYEDIVLGERIQVDHMTRTINGVTVKHFSAWERLSKWSHAQIYSNAKAKSAKKFFTRVDSKNTL